VFSGLGIKLLEAEAAGIAEGRAYEELWDTGEAGEKEGAPKFPCPAEEEAAAKLLDPLLELAAELVTRVVTGAAYKRLGTAGEYPTPVCSWPSGTETAEELLALSNVNTGEGAPYTGDGFSNVEEPSLPENVGSA
jgi:hypothetical protein